jgi:hypothetical protein
VTSIAGNSLYDKKRYECGMRRQWIILGILFWLYEWSQEENRRIETGRQAKK